MEFLELLIRTVSSILTLFLVTKVMGYRQISQLSFYDYVIGISIGSISADMAVGLDVDWWYTLVPMVLYGSGSLLLSHWTTKSIRARRFLSGVPVILLEKGELIRENFEKVHYDMSDFLAECRSAGYFDLGDLQYVIMEHTGKLSFLPKSEKRPCCPEDLNLCPAEEGLCANLIIDGKLMPHHLKRIGRDETWLQKQLKQQGVSEIEQVLLASYPPDGSLQIYLQSHDKKTFNVLD